MSNDLLRDFENDIFEDDQRIYEPSGLKGFSDWFKESSDHSIWWIEDLERRGRHLFSFDKKKIYNVFADYPNNMTEEEVAIFDKEEEYWANFLEDKK